MHWDQPRPLGWLRQLGSRSADRPAPVRPSSQVDHSFRRSAQKPGRRRSCAYATTTISSSWTMYLMSYRNPAALLVRTGSSRRSPLCKPQLCGESTMLLMAVSTASANLSPRPSRRPSRKNTVSRSSAWAASCSHHRYVTCDARRVRRGFGPGHLVRQRVLPRRLRPLQHGGRSRRPRPHQYRPAHRPCPDQRLTEASERPLTAHQASARNPPRCTPRASVSCNERTTGRRPAVSRKLNDPAGRAGSAVCLGLLPERLDLPMSGPAISASRSVTGTAVTHPQGVGPHFLRVPAICTAAWAAVRCVVSTTSASRCSHERAASA